MAVALKSISITALPSCPRLVVTRITPLAPFTPNTAVAEASLSTDMFSTEDISTELSGRSTPSTNIRGALLFHEVCPRRIISGSSSPGIPELCFVTTPGKFPVSAAPTLDTPPARSSTLPEVCEIEPTTEAFFCCPYPTTTTSSSISESSRNITTTILRPFTFTSCGVIPKYETVSTAFLSGTSNVKLPSKSATVPTVLLLFSTTAAPIKGSLFASRTFPFTTKFCAINEMLPNNNRKKKTLI